MSCLYTGVLSFWTDFHAHTCVQTYFFLLCTFQDGIEEREYLIFFINIHANHGLSCFDGMPWTLNLYKHVNIWFPWLFNICSSTNLKIPSVFWNGRTLHVCLNEQCRLVGCSILISGYELYSLLNTLLVEDQLSQYCMPHANVWEF